ncbi:phage antirepressor KilAC domain-containing protein [Acinetobacter baumannii]|uniref:phage antirepressor KilAC domain-containing protein n=1 Tax=Acinetobacter baumannii TaxID=470 RepID=UPI000810BB57|nr:phage antirepressor KilAC domain-containing protein [Acinetobacter baumannii]EME5683844.1 phage antirepressor KilAC domain-containing protein [Acinetobacter baumannii]MDC5120158.1 phage antirepressor KilAC domain-containing protein [Acinetobacter baumannii]PPC15672.1 DNA-binding protein [Acinetobacter baumannii]PPC43410.1 DNA-binding protein [Acinetobacter baumannii]
MNMPILTQFGNSEQSMNSLEISELCQKRHDNVKRLVENLINQQVIACPQIEVVQKEANNRIYNIEVYVFTGEQGKLDSITVVAQLCPEFTAAIVKRWYELENQNAAQLPRTFAEALQLAADQARQLELAAPKVQYFDKVVDRSTLLNATQVAQKLGMSAVAMNKLLDDLDVYSRNVKRARVFKQWFIDAGYGELKQTELGFSQPMFTTKGEAWVIEKLVSEGAA